MAETATQSDDQSKLAKFQAKMDARKANRNRKFDDPFEQTVHFLTQEDARLAPNVFIEYVALLIRSYAGAKETFKFTANISNFHSFLEGEYGLIGVPDRKTRQTSLCILNDHFEWETHGGFDLGQYAHAPKMVFLDCGNQQVAENDIRKRYMCVFAPGDGAWVPQALAHTHPEDHLLYVTQSKYGGDEPFQPEVCKPRRHANQIVLHIWKQGRKIYALIVFIKAKLQFELCEIDAVFDENDLVTPVQCALQTRWECQTDEDFVHYRLGRLSGAYYDESTDQVIGCMEKGRFMRIYGSGVFLMGHQATPVALFGRLDEYDALFGLSRDGKVFVVDLAEVSDGEISVEADDIVALRQVSEFSLWGLKTGTLFYNAETQMIHFVSQLLSSSSAYKYAMTVFPIAMQLL